MLDSRGGPSVAPRTDPSLGIDHAVPGNPAAVVERGEGIADLPRLTGQTRQERDLPVGGHAPARNPRDDRIDPLAADCAGRHDPENTQARRRLRVARAGPSEER